jgi:hypothetical protein
VNGSVSARVVLVVVGPLDVGVTAAAVVAVMCVGNTLAVVSTAFVVSVFSAVLVFSSTAVLVGAALVDVTFDSVEVVSKVVVVVVGLHRS